MLVKNGFSIVELDVYAGSNVRNFYSKLNYRTVWKRMRKYLPDSSQKQRYKESEQSVEKNV